MKVGITLPSMIELKRWLRHPTNR